MRPVKAAVLLPPSPPPQDIWGASAECKGLDGPEKRPKVQFLPWEFPFFLERPAAKEVLEGDTY